MMRIQLNFWIFILGFFHLTACNVVYMSNSMNVPLFEEKNEVKLAVIGNPIKWETQSAYSISDKYGIITNAYLGNFNGLDAAFGYYNVLPNKCNFEAFVGYGQAWDGQISQLELSSYSSDTVSGAIVYSRFFSQIHFGVPLSKNWKIALAFRPNLLYYNKHYYNRKYYSYEEGGIGDELRYDLEIFAKSKFAYALDPSFYMECNWESLCLNMQLGYSYSNANIGINYLYREGGYGPDIVPSEIEKWTWSVGVKLNIDDSFK